MVARLLQLGGCMRLGRRRGERRDGGGKVDEKMRRGVSNSLIYITPVYQK